MTNVSAAAANATDGYEDAQFVPCDCALPSERLPAEEKPQSSYSGFSQSMADTTRKAFGIRPSASVKFTVPGTPVAKGRPRFARRGNVVTTYSPEKTVNFETLVKMTAWETMAESGTKRFENALAVQVHAYFPVPASWSNKRRQAALEGRIGHTVRPDSDNAAKAILDGCSVLWRDDSQIVALMVTKCYSDNPRTEVTVWEVSQ